jgi:RHS repeat-associated protein
VFTSGGSIVARNDYYAFGKSHINNTLAVADKQRNRWLFNGAESQLIGGLPLLDYGARMYNPEIGRWETVDPLMEHFFSHSPFSYATNNPINYIDLFGLEPIKVPGGTIGTFDGYGTVTVIDTIEVLGSRPAQLTWVEIMWRIDSRIRDYKKGNIFVGMSFGGAPNSKVTVLRPGYKNYVYSEADLENRNFFLSDRAYRGFTITLMHLEARGYMEPLTYTGYYNLYGETLGNLKAFAMFGSMMFSVGGPAAAGGVSLPAARGFNFSSPLGRPIYSPRVGIRALKEPIYHNYPYSFDRTILSTQPHIYPSGYRMYQYPGYANGRYGVYEIGIERGIINHRFFRPK